MTEPTVLSALDGSVLTITLNRPQALNALTPAMYTELASALMRAAQDDVRAVVLTGAGRGFCPGQDLNEAGSDDPASDLPYVDGTVRGLRNLAKPVVAAINGAAAGGGMAYALACDIRLVADTAKFAPAFLDLGLVPDLGTSALLTELLGADRALQWLLSGRKLSAAEALGWGLVHEVLPAAELLPQAQARAHALARRPTRAIGLTKRLLQAARTNGFEAQLGAEAEAQALAGRTEDYQEALAAFRERRTPNFKGR